MYFESKIIRHRGLPWMGHLSSDEEASNTYFENLEDIVERVDHIETSTYFYSYLSVNCFTTGYQFALARIKGLRNYLLNDSPDDNRELLLDDLREVFEDLKYLSSDALLYEHDTTDVDDTDFDDLNDLDLEDDDFAYDDDDFDDEDDDFDDDGFDDDEDSDW